MSDFTRLLEAEIPRLRRYARALTRDAVYADDLVQSCLARALAKQHLWQPGTDLRAWLFTILHNQHCNELRRTMREGLSVELDRAPPVSVRSNALAALKTARSGTGDQQIAGISADGGLADRPRRNAV